MSEGRGRASTSLSLAAVLLLPILGWLIFSPGLTGGFLFDDQPNLVNDPDWKIDQISWSAFVHLFGSGISSASGRPLAVASFAVNYLFTGMDPLPLKATGLVMHLLNALLVFLLGRALLSVGTSFSRSAVTAVAWALAFAWMVHPIQVSSALYIIQRMEIGAATGILLSLLSYLRARRALVENSSAWPWWALFVLSTIFAFGFKETALLIPAYTFILEVFILRFEGHNRFQRKMLMLVYGIGALLGLIAFFSWVLPVALAPVTYAARDFSLSERLYTQLTILVFYLRQILLPWPESLVFYYDNYPISKGLLSPVSTLFSALLLSCLAVSGWVLRGRWRLTALGIAWFFVSHALTSNVLPLELVFEHRNYLALFGIILAILQPLQALLKRLTREARVFCIAAALLYVGTMGFVQAMSWGNPVGLALTLTTRNPGSARAGYEYGRTLLGLAANEPSAPGWSMALREFEHAASLPNSSPLSDQALIILASSTGQSVPDATWKRFGGKLLRRSVGPQELSALEGVVECRVQRKCKFADEQQLFRLLVLAVQRNPGSARLRAVYANYAFNVMSDRELAVRMIRDAVSLEPREPGYRSWLVRIGLASNLLSSQEAEEALELLRRSNGSGTYTRDIWLLEQWLGNQ